MQFSFALYFFWTWHRFNPLSLNVDCRYSVWRYQPMRGRAAPGLLPATGPSCNEMRGRPYCPKFFSPRHGAPLKHLRSMANNTVSREFFDEKYRVDPDPWNFSSSAYELNRYDELVRSLGDRTFHRGFEPGCSIGVLTRTSGRPMRASTRDGDLAKGGRSGAAALREMSERSCC